MKRGFRPENCDFEITVEPKGQTVFWLGFEVTYPNRGLQGGHAHCLVKIYQKMVKKHHTHYFLAEEDMHMPVGRLMST